MNSNEKMLREERLSQLRYLENKGVNPYPPEPPNRTNTNREITTRYKELEGTEVDVLGRIVSTRPHGKVLFATIRDDSGDVQIFLNINDNPEELADFKAAYRPGDIIAVGGKVIKTRNGEPTVKLQKLTMLAKAILPPLFASEYTESIPVGTETKEQIAENDRLNEDKRFVADYEKKKNHSKDNMARYEKAIANIEAAKEKPTMTDVLSDPEDRSRQRYLDMIAHREIRERFRFRSQMVQFMRERFMDLDCWEVETPIMDNQYGGANARPFITHHNALNTDLFLRISDELYLKKLMVGGMSEGVFEFSRDFRNEGMDYKHNPEFTQVELYKAYTDYLYMMKMSENLIADMAQKFLGSTSVNYQGQDIDLSVPWRRLSIYDGIKEQMGIDFEKLTPKEIQELAKREGIEETDPGYIALKLFDLHVEHTLVNPTFVIDYPASTSPLTKTHRSKPGLVERFECVVAGMEVMNCYTELNDPRLQRANFEGEEGRKDAGDQEAMPTDDDFVKAMEYGMPPMGGIGISIDRWCMLLTDANHIREVIAFPVLKPRK